MLFAALLRASPRRAAGALPGLRAATAATAGVHRRRGGGASPGTGAAARVAAAGDRAASADAAIGSGTSISTMVAAEPAPARGRRRGETAEEKRARKAAARAGKRARRSGEDPLASAKPCGGCGRPSDLLVRCRYADSGGAWRMLCGRCWRQASGGVADGDASHPHYTYGGLWKSAARRQGVRLAEAQKTPAAGEDADERLLEEALRAKGEA